ncbi:hypothetical protein NV391_04495 [Companilactobacillus crustorum]|uniref:hypothetical protein n=1 Tax=Companilactobacillus crustorum TaxID=392416 RepID=UPI000ED4318C|nr:hypothetical protein [Companilactobacillus crustorum]WDT66468.1 hypothetical protein NV391_04495 [Companilactobacillus crustorum]HCD07257.1 hypothetical protein [Lactobacillus sp.]
MNNEIKYIMDELTVIYGFYQDKFSQKRIKSYILSMPEGSHIVNVEPGNVALFDQEIILPIAQFNDQSDSFGLLQVNHSTVQNRSDTDIAADSQRVADLVNRLIRLVSPQNNN